MDTSADDFANERQLTDAPYGHILTNIGVWSPDSQWIYYDVRSDPAGSLFDGERIERVHVETGRSEVVYRSSRGACCGVVTASPVDDRIVFIHGPENPTSDWSYCAWHRRGVVVDVGGERRPATLDARNLMPPFTPGALRGGTHLHVFSGDGAWISFTYEDHVLATSDNRAAAANRRNVGVAAPCEPVRVPSSHPRNHDGAAYSVLVTTTVDHPTAGSDEIGRAFSDAWVGREGYVRADGSRQRRALAFFGEVVASGGSPHNELFLVDIPDHFAPAAAGPLEGTLLALPSPPEGTVQRRLTRTSDRPYPGVSAPRHWPRSSPDGSQIAFLMQDEGGLVQLWTISPLGGNPLQLTSGRHAITSAFSWHPDGSQIAFVSDGSVCVVEAGSGSIRRLTPRGSHARVPLGSSPRSEACVFSPDGERIAYIRSVPHETGKEYNQLFVAAVAPSLRA